LTTGVKGIIGDNPTLSAHGSKECPKGLHIKKK
jgi:hypothetical protein